MEETIKLDISTCLLGENVRYDGGHKLDRSLCETLGKYVEHVPACPEAETDLGVSREAMRLVGDPSAPRLVAVRSGRDFTERMVARAKKRVSNLKNKELCGLIFKGRSPSSGMERGQGLQR